MKTLIIVPAYNEQENILKVIHDLENNLKGWDYLVVNDCSKDETGKLLDQHGINHVDLPVNLGLSGAVQMGYKYAYYYDYDTAIQFDGDGQHQAKYIPLMEKEIEEGYNIVIGSRFVNESKDFSLRMMGSRLITLLIKLMTGKTVADPTSGMRMLDRKMIYDYAFNMNRNPEPDTLAYQMKRGAKVKEIQVQMNLRTAGTSIYSGMMSSFKYMMKMIFSIIFFTN